MLCDLLFSLPGGETGLMVALILALVVFAMSLQGGGRPKRKRRSKKR